MTTLNEYEVAALKLIAGQPQDVFTGWGAALGVCIEAVAGAGMARQEMRHDGLHYIITDKGRDYLAREAAQ